MGKNEIDLRDASAITIELDRDLTVTNVDRAWDLRADSFGADHCFGRELCGTNLLAHIAGKAPRAFFRQLYTWVATHTQRLHLPYRCDAPDRIRHMDMQIDPTETGFRCTHRTLFTAARNSATIRYAFFDEQTGHTKPWCSQCMSIYSDGTWKGIQDAVMDGFEVGVGPFPVFCTLCPTCMDSMNRLLGTARSTAHESGTTAPHNQTEPRLNA
ncbi:MAG: hypothetical protein U0172_03215 [Nitrospiraceae bacterium]